MKRLHDSAQYERIVICPHCHHSVEYHVTELKGVEPAYIKCPYCSGKIELEEKKG